VIVSLVGPLAMTGVTITNIKSRATTMPKILNLFIPYYLLFLV